MDGKTTEGRKDSKRKRVESMTERNNSKKIALGDNMLPNTDDQSTTELVSNSQVFDTEDVTDRECSSVPCTVLHLLSQYSIFFFMKIFQYFAYPPYLNRLVIIFEQTAAFRTRNEHTTVTSCHLCCALSRSKLCDHRKRIIRYHIIVILEEDPYISDNAIIEKLRLLTPINLLKIHQDIVKDIGHERINIRLRQYGDATTTLLEIGNNSTPLTCTPVSNSSLCIHDVSDLLSSIRNRVTLLEITSNENILESLKSTTLYDVEKEKEFILDLIGLLFESNQPSPSPAVSQNQ